MAFNQLPGDWNLKSNVIRIRINTFGNLYMLELSLLSIPTQHLEVKPRMKRLMLVINNLLKTDLSL